MSWIKKNLSTVIILELIVIGCIVVFYFWQPLSEITKGSQDLAAWVQALGVFAAVFLSGWIANNQARKQEIERVRRNTSSVSSVVGRGLTALNNISNARDHQSTGTKERDPVLMLKTISEALTPKRIIELPDMELIGLALDIKAGIDEIVKKLEETSPLTPAKRISLENLSQDIMEKINRTTSDCTTFVKYEANLNLTN